MFGNLFKKYKNLNIVEKILFYFIIICLVVFFSQSFFRMSEIQIMKQKIKKSDIITSFADGEIRKIYFDYLLGITKSKGKNTATFHILGINRKFPLTVYYEANEDNVKITNYEVLGNMVKPSNNNSNAVVNNATFGYSTRILISLISISVLTFIVIVIENQEKWEKHIQKSRYSVVYLKLKSIFCRPKLTANIIILVYFIIMLYFVAFFINLCFYLFII